MDKTRLEKLRSAGQHDLLGLDIKTLREGGMAALEVAEVAEDARHRIMVECGGRSPTRAQQEDLNKALEIRTEYGALAERLHKAQEAQNDTVRDAAQRDIENGDVQFSDPNAQVAGDGVDYSKVVNAGAANRAGYENQGRHTGRGLTYNQGDQRSSWLKDIKDFTASGDPSARDRLARNNREAATENRAIAGNIAGAVGEFVPPVWAMNLMAQVARPGRVFADQINHAPLPKTNTIDIPRLTGGTATATQATENSNVQQTNATSDSISATVATIAGTQIVSNQLLDQSPVSMDAIILGDLARDLAVKVDQFTLNANATGQVGVLNLSGVNSVAYTDASPTVGELYSKLADAMQRIATLRYMPASKLFLHPRRWAWLTAALDTALRPLIVPLAAQGPQNALANQGGVVAEGLVGSILGIPCFTDPSIPTNLGAGTNQDPIIVAHTDDLYLFESPVVVIPDRWSLSGQLSTRLTISQYVAVVHGRYPASISIVNGTGLIAPTF